MVMNKRLSLLAIIVSISLNLFAENTQIYTTGSSSIESLSNFLAYGNNSLGKELTDEFAKIYIEESKAEGINWDVAFIQMCLETGFLKYGGLVEPGQNNFCGLGSFDSKQGASFPTIREGVRAHVQHLKAYATADELNGELIDPRFHLVTRGSATDVMALAGRWAEDPKYGIKLTSLLKRMNYLEYKQSVLLASVKTNEKYDKLKEDRDEDKKLTPPEPIKAEEKSGWLP